MKIRHALLLAGLSTTLWVPFSIGAPTTAPASPPPATQPAGKPDPAVQALVDKLADPSAAVREDASKKLSSMGKEALATLRESANSDDPELRARVRSLLRRAERRLPPSAPASDGRFQHQSMSVSISNGHKTIDVNDNGHKIRIEHNGEKIKLDVTGVEEGKEVTETYEAKDADELKKDNPEAYALFDKWASKTTSGVIIQGGNGIGVQGRVGVHIGQINVGGNGQPNLPPEAAAKIREMIKQQIQQGNLPADQQEKILEQLRDVDKLQKDVEQRLQEKIQEREEKKPEDQKPGAPGDE
jgi:hypothetical protein